MVTFRSNNNRRPPFRSNNNRRPPFRSNNQASNFSNSDNFQRKIPARNNHNASKLIEKYNDMAREALANEDRVLSENYFQHADHFTRVQNEQEKIRMAKVHSSPSGPVNNIKTEGENIREEVKIVKTEVVGAKEITPESETKKVIKTSENKSVTG